MFDNKKILILGLARSGYEAAKFLKDKNCDITVTDMKEDIDKVKELESLGIKCIITNKQEDLLDETFDYVIKNPGVPIDAPLVLKAGELNIPVTNEVEVAYSYLPKTVEIIGITGSNGKTTTTTIIYEYLKKEGLNVHLGGNIGIPACKLIENIKEGDYLVIELSSHQLHDFNNFKTNISVLTNVTETHLEHFYTYDAYKNSKKKAFNNHTENDLAIINLVNKESLNLTSDIKSTKQYFSSKEEKGDCYIKNNRIYYHEEMIINLDDIRIKGIHNYENIMAAILAVKKYNVSTKSIVEVLKEFPGVEHRIEFVKEQGGRYIYNDSKSTNILATKIALSSFNNQTILLLGGLDRNQAFEELLPYLKNTKKIVAYGEMKESVKAFADKHNIPCDIEDILENAVYNAYNSSVEGDVILLSPAAASWDQFKDYEERGKIFKETVQTLQ
ncbi:MAG: UDP-N-acetylmuramoyl-L-alanine--D-glutamate ligase [Bacilli bacterium]|nr:UDP-N-acetylmuramoyl-L-alanine--D-glutamate ligase [Bacilli bacterium]